MNDGLARNWNSRVAEDDTVFHLGDFCCFGRERGEDGLKLKASHWESLLNGRIVHILGNHDENNTLRRGLDLAVIRLGGMRLLLKHMPIFEYCCDPSCDVVVCGHVHERWRLLKKDGVLFVNVGVDVRGYAPVRSDELVQIIKDAEKELEEEK